MALSMEICSLLLKGAIEKVPLLKQRDTFYSTYFLVPKKDGGFRPVLDLQCLNVFLKCLPFRMLRTVDVLWSVMKGDWFVSVDLRDAYFHVPIALHHRKFLRFSFQGQVYQFRVLPFGLSLAPRVFTRCMSASLSPLWSKGMRILPYLDDWLLCAPTRVHALCDTKIVLEHILKLGLTVNDTKSHLVPEQTITFIGITLNSVTMSATLSHTRTDSIFQLLTRFRMGARIPYGVLLQLMGMLAAATSVIPLGLLHLRPLQRWNNSLGLNSTRHRYHMIVVTPACVRALKLKAMYLPGSDNQVADVLSWDLLLPGEWRLHPDVVQLIWQQFSRAEVDLFASELTTHCRWWFARTETSSPLGQDALDHEWPNCLLYAFPPFPLLWETLHRIFLSKHRELLVAPRWRRGFLFFWVCYRANRGSFQSDGTSFLSWTAVFGTQIQLVFSFGFGQWVHFSVNWLWASSTEHYW